MIKLKFKLIILFLLFFTMNTVYADYTPACTTTQECKDFGSGFGPSILGIGLLVGALIVPHHISSQESSFPSFKFAFGEQNLKSFIFDIRSNPSINSEILISTNLDIQVFDKKTPSTVQYGIGTGYNFKLYQNFNLLPMVKLAAEAIESANSTQVAPEMALVAHYSSSDYLDFFISSRYLFFNDPTQKISTGFNYKYSKTGSPFLISLGYEDQKLIDKTFYSITIGFGFD